MDDQSKLSKEIVKVLESRVHQINELESYANYIENEFKMVTSQLGLKDEDIDKHAGKRICPYDKGHSVPITSYDKHVEKCAVRKMGYSEEDLRKNPPSSKFYYENNPDIKTVIIDKNLQSHILYQAAQQLPFINGIEGPRGIRGHPQALQNLEVPLTNDRAITELTEAERLAIYDYIVECSKTDKKSCELTLEDLQFSFELQNKNKEGKPKSKLEILAELRDYKRRRQSYRAKNVHITKKSYTEVMKEVISNMTVFLESMNESTELKTEEIDRASTSRIEASEKTQLPSAYKIIKNEKISDPNSPVDSFGPLHSLSKRLSPMRERSRNGKRLRDSSECRSGKPRKTRRNSNDRSRSSTPRKTRRNSNDRSRSSTPRKTRRSRRNSNERSRSSTPRKTRRSRGNSHESLSSTPRKSCRKRGNSSEGSKSPSCKRHSHKKNHRKKSRKHKHKRVKKETYSPDDSGRSS